MVSRFATYLAIVAGCGFTPGASTPGDGGAPDAATIDAAPPVADGPPGSTSRRKVKLTFVNGSRAIALDNFVVLVVLDPSRIDYALTKPNGANLELVDSDGTPLTYEIDEWVPNGTSYVWVRVPRIDASSNTDFIYLHYGDPTVTVSQDPHAVWAGYSAVWHLSQDPGIAGAGTIKDSTSAQNHGSVVGMQSADRVPGMIGNGFYFDGAQAGVTANAITLPTYTWSLWVRGDTASATASSNKKPISNGDQNFNFAWEHSDPAFTGAIAQHDESDWRKIQPPTAWSGMRWYFVVGSYGGGQLCVYRDGTGTCTSSGAPLSPIGDFEIGLAASGSTTFAGRIDEVRVSPTAFPAARIDAEFANQRADPANPFVMFGATELD